jgi:hypothetical protein
VRPKISCALREAWPLTLPSGPKATIASAMPSNRRASSWCALLSASSRSKIASDMWLKAWPSCSNSSPLRTTTCVRSPRCSLCVPLSRRCSGRSAAWPVTHSESRHSTRPPEISVSMVQSRISRPCTRTPRLRETCSTSAGWP